MLQQYWNHSIGSKLALGLMLKHYFWWVNSITNLSDPLDHRGDRFTKPAVWTKHGEAALIHYAAQIWTELPDNINLPQQF